MVTCNQEMTGPLVAGNYGILEFKVPLMINFVDLNELQRAQISGQTLSWVLL